MDKHLFVDLEETLITNWHDPYIGPLATVLDALDTHFGPARGVIDATVWSFAVLNQKDVDHFNKTMKSWLEGVFGLNFIRVVPMEEMLNAVIEFKGWHHDRLDLIDMSQIWGKDGTLECWIPSRFSDCEVILLDDTVENRTVTWHDKNLSLRTVKI